MSRASKDWTSSGPCAPTSSASAASGADAASRALESGDQRAELRDRGGVEIDIAALTEAQRAELDRRLDELEVEGPVGIPWDEVLSRIHSRGR